MVNDSKETLASRFVNLLTMQLKANMPRPGGEHIYSRGNMYRNFHVYKTPTSYIIEISTGVDYSHYALGFRDDGSKRNPRGQLERKNFKLIETQLRAVAAMIASNNGGGVIYD